MKRLLCIGILLAMCFSSQALAAGIPTPAVGDVIVFGSYEQDNQLDNGKEPLEWIVLDVQDGKAMLLTKYCIDTVIFYPKRVPMYWGKSDLRAWSFCRKPLPPRSRNASLPPPLPIPTPTA